MMKRVLVAVLVVGLALAGSSQASVYDYTENGMDGSDWSWATYDGTGYLPLFYTITTGGDWHRVDHTLETAGGAPSRGAFVWEAPVGETITQIDFSWAHSTDPAAWSQAVYELQPGEAMSLSTSKIWEADGYGWATGNVSLVFQPTDNVQRIGLGFDNRAYSVQGWMMQFSDVTITTVPEPMTLGLLSLGGLRLVRRKA